MEIWSESRPGNLDFLFDDEQDVREWWKQFLDEDAFEEVLDGAARDTSAGPILTASDTSSSPDGVVRFHTPEDSFSSPMLLVPPDLGPSPPASSSLASSRSFSRHQRRRPARPGARSSPSQPPQDPFIICFPADPAAPGGIKKKRRDFDSCRRREVASVRRARACVRCRLRKVSCDTHAICEACSAAAGPMAAFMCSRKKLRETRAASADFRAVEYTMEVLAHIERERVPLEGTTRDMVLRFGASHPGYPSVRVIAQKYGPERLMGEVSRGVRIKEVGDDYQYVYRGGSQYMLVHTPSADELVALMEAHLVASRHRDVGFANAIDRFVMRYSRGAGSLPLRDLVTDVHRLSCLTKVSHFVAYVGCPDGADPVEASTSAGIQLALVGKAAAQALEEGVLARLDKLLFEGKGTGTRNGLALWACLWVLIQEYRMLTRFFDAFRQADAGLPRLWLGEPPYDLEMARHMYNYLVSVYSALFKSTTPLYIDWRLDANRDLFARDENLLQAFKSLRTETMYFHQDSRLLTSPEDRFLKQMVLDQEMAMDPRVAMERRNSTQPAKKRAGGVCRMESRDPREAGSGAG